jgi:hypothetical protein
VISVSNTFAQLTGTKTVGTGGDYSTLADAITALNSQGVGTGGVTFNVAAGHTENTTSQLTITATGISGNSIIFQKSGTGNNPIITRTDAGSNTTSVIGGLGDAVIRLDGTDYITFDGIDITASQSGIEYGYFTHKPSGTNGCQYVTIKNSVVTMTKGTSAYVIGIYIGNGAASTSSSTGVAVSANSGRNENINIIGNTIQNVHAGIYCRGSSATGFYDTDYVIGQSGAGNTIQNFGGGSATTTYGIYFIYVTNPSVSYNTINNAGGGGSAHASSFYGIFYSTVLGNVVGSNNTFTVSQSSTSSSTYYLYNGNAVTSENYNNNTFAAGTLSSTGTVYLIYASNATNSKTISGNQTSGTISKTSASGSLYCYYNAGSPTSGTEQINNNNFSNISVSGSSSLYGIYSSTSTSTSRNCYNNTINTWTGGTGSTYAYYLLSTLTNTIYNNNASSITAGGTVYGMYFSGTNPNVYNNIITNNTTSGSTMYGIYDAGTGTTNCHRNQVYNLTGNNTSQTLYGIYVTTGSANYVYNNYICDLKTPSSGSTASLAGIYASGGSLIGLYYNTIFLNASSTGANFGCSGIYASTTPTVDIRNNIVMNTSTPVGTGFTVAYRRSTTTLTTYSNNSNNNCFYAGTPGASRLIFYDGSNSDQTMTDYKNRVGPRDGASFSVSPDNIPFINYTTLTPPNLHMDEASTQASQIESGGQRITTPAITNDFDEEYRWGESSYSGTGSAPDVGADEFEGVGLDLSSPIITYTPLQNTSSTGNRTLTATITDASGVPTSGTGLPMLYWKINAGSYSGVQGVSIGSNQYTFTFGSGVVATDVVSYYVVAQDNNNNVGANPSSGASGFTANPPACSTPPTTPNTYTIIGSISGTFTVGATGDYTSITNAVNDINNKEVVGPVVLSLIDANYNTETFPIVIPQFTGVSSSNTVTIKPASGNTVTISGTSLTSIFKLNGADYIIIDGSNSTIDGTDRSLTITNTSTSGTTAAIWLASLGTGTGATNNTIKNCNISNGFISSGAYGIFVGGSSIGSSGDDNDNTSIQNNSITKAYYGIYCIASSLGLNSGMSITQNSIGSNTSTDYITYKGIYVQGANPPLISQNNVFNVISANSTNNAGIELGSDVNGAVISRNLIYGIKSNATGGYGAYGINLSSGSNVTNVELSNNIIYDITTINYSTSSTTYNPFGIRLTGGTNTKLYYNSINLFGTQFSSGSSGTLSAALLITSSSVTGLDIRNNIFANGLEGLYGSNSYSVYAVSGVTFGTINYNDYYGYGTYGKLGFLGTEKLTLTDWQAATTQDLNSIATNPMFNSNTNLQPQSGSPVLAAGTPITGITIDYSGATRSGTTPSIGAYETGVDVTGPIITYTPFNNTSSTGNRTLTATITDASGVPTSGTGLPMLYWKINAGSYSGVQGVSIGSDQYTFTFGSGVVANDVVSYYVVAQDNVGTPNVSCNPSTGASGFSSNPPAVSTPPTSPNTYTIVGSISGTKTVGTGGDYATITDAVNSYNNSEQTGPVVFSLTDANYSTAETFPIVINQNGGASSTNTLTIKPASGINPVITGTSTSSIFKLNGADYIIIDGSNTTDGNNLTISNSSTAANTAAIWIVSLGNGLGATNNTIKYCNIAAGSNTTTSTFGIFVGGTTISTSGNGADNDYLTIQNNNIYRAYYGIYAAGISTGTNNNLSVIQNNIGANTSTDYITFRGLLINQTTSSLISNNKIFNLIYSSTNIRGMEFGNGFINSEVSSNYIYNIEYSATSFSAGKGMTFDPGSGAGNLNIFNNVIYGLKGHGSSTATNNSWGIMISSGTDINVYYNSINISDNRSTTSSADKHGCIYIGSTATSLNIKNNIFNITGNPGNLTTGYMYSIYSLAANTAFTGINYNNYFASGTRSMLGYINTTNQATLTDWKTATTQDVNSINVDPMFNSNTNLQPQTGSPVLGVGTPITGISTDIIGITRNATTPSIGAYEQGGDGQGPTINYSTLGNTNSTSNRTLNNVTITDASGVDWINTPRIYYKKSTDNNVFGGNTSADNGWKWTTANVGSSPTNFTINYSLIFGGSVTTNDIIQYFVVAQDNNSTPNVSANPSPGFSATSVSSITSSPTTPNQYKITDTPLSGTYTVGTAMFNKVSGLNLTFEKRTRLVERDLPQEKIIEYQKKSSSNSTNLLEETENLSKDSKAYKSPEYLDLGVSTYTKQLVEEEYFIPMLNGKEYNGSLFIENDSKETKTHVESSLEIRGFFATITAALTALNERGISGPTLFSLVDATYPTETFPLQVNINNENAPTSTNTFTIKPAATIIPTITGAVASNGIFTITNTNFVIIDGSNIEGGTSRDLTISNTSTTSPKVINVGSLGTNPISNVTIKNNILINGVNTSSALVVGDATTQGNAGYFSNITIDNNEIRKAYIGMYIRGGDGGVQNGSNVTITNNILTSTGTDAIALCGIYLQGVNGVTARLNEVGNLDPVGAQDDRGMWLATGTSNAIVERNKIFNCGYTGTSGYGAQGIAISSGITNCNNLIRNNLIYNMYGDGWDYSNAIGDNPMGIYAFSNQTGVYIYNNSINLYGNTLNQANAISCGILLDVGTTARVINNCVVNNLGISGSIGLGSFGVWLSSGASQFEQANWNNYWINPSGSGSKYIGRLVGVNYSSLPLWKSDVGQDLNSVSGDPAYTSNTNLLPDVTNANSWIINGVGMPSESVPNDFTGAPRSTSQSGGSIDVGAYEFTPTTTAPSGTPSGSPLPSTITNYTYGNTTLGSIYWGSSGTLPSGINFIYHPGQNPPSGLRGSQANCYWEITQTGGSGFTYDITFNYSESHLGNISSESQIRVAKSEDNGASWTAYMVSGTGVGEYQLNTTNNSITVYGLTSFSLFTLTGGDNPLPVELTSFAANSLNRDIKLDWQTKTENNSSRFEVERKVVDNNGWTKIASVNASGNSNSPKQYSYIDRKLNSGKYQYRLKMIDNDGTFSYSNVIETEVDLPKNYALSQNYPNPFNPSTRIDYQLPFDSKVMVEIYTITGERIASLINQEQKAGYYTLELNAGKMGLSSGVYIYRMIAQNKTDASFSQVKKMLMIK